MNGTLSIIVWAELQSLDLQFICKYKRIKPSNRKIFSINELDFKENLRMKGLNLTK